MTSSITKLREAVEAGERLVFRRDGSLTIGETVIGYWTREQDLRPDRKAVLVFWCGCLKGGHDSPLFPLKKDLRAWIIRELGRKLAQEADQ